MPGIILLIVIASIAMSTIASYTRLMRMRDRVVDAWLETNLHVEHRHDLLLELVNAVRTRMRAEGATLTAVMEARAAALDATAPGDAARKERQLSAAVGVLLDTTETYATLRSDADIDRLREEWTGAEKTISRAGDAYNDVATTFNVALQLFPASLFAHAFGFKGAELFEIDTAADGEAPLLRTVVR